MTVGLFDCLLRCHASNTPPIDKKFGIYYYVGWGIDKIIGYLSSPKNENETGDKNKLVFDKNSVSVHF